VTNYWNRSKPLGKQAFRVYGEKDAD